MVTHVESWHSVHNNESLSELHAAMQAAHQATDRLNAAITRVANGGVETHRLPTANLLRVVLQRTIEGETLDEDCEKLIATLSKVTGGQDLNLIERPYTTPARPAAEVTRPQFESVGEGFYGLVTDSGLKYIKVQQNLSGDRLYARMWDSESETWNYEAAKNARALRRLTPKMALTAEQSKEFGDLYGRCVFCSAQLNDDRSIAAGYGPICAEKHELPWG